MCLAAPGIGSPTSPGRILILGGAGAWYAGRFLTELLYEVPPGDLLTLGSVMVVVSISSLFAAWLPARRAARVDPAIALRAE